MEVYVPLAKTMANKYIGKITKEEAESAAYLGMAIALRSWQPDKGALSSWIRLYTKMTLIREVNRQSLIKIPQSLAPKLSNVKKLYNEGKDIMYIAKETKLTKQQVQDLVDSPSVELLIEYDENIFTYSNE